MTNIACGVPEEDTDAPAGISEEETFYTQEQGLSKAEKAAVATASIFFLLLLILCCLWRRHLRRRHQEEAWTNPSVATQDTAMPGRGSDADDSSYITGDFNNLGLHHYKLDVHRCKSGMCEVCTPTQDDPPGVFFVSSKGSTPLTSIIEIDNEDIMSGSGGGTSPEDMHNDERRAGTKGLFSRFFQSTTQKEDPIIRPYASLGPNERTRPSRRMSSHWSTKRTCTPCGTTTPVFA